MNLDFHRYWQLVSRSGAFVLFLLIAVPVLAQGTEGANQKALREITLNLTEGIVNQTLPFDVPFILRGEVPTTVIEVRAYLAQPTAEAPPADAGQAITGINCDAIAWNELTPVQRWTPPPPTALAPTGAATTTINANRAVFRLRMPELEVNTDYCMHFEMERRLTEMEATRFRERAFRAIDDVLRTLGLQARNQLTQPELETLRQRLIAEITATNSGIRARPGTLFDPRPVETMSPAELSAAQGDLSKRLVAALTPQFQRITRVNTYAGLVQKTLAAVDSIRNEPFLQNADTVAAITKQLMATNAADAETFQQLLALPSPVVFGLATGLAAGQSGTPPAQLVGAIWIVDQTTTPCSAKEIDTIRANLIASRGFFQRLAGALRSKPIVAPLKPPADAEHKALLSLVDTIFSNVNAANLSLQEFPGLLCRRTAAINDMVDQLQTEAVETVRLLITTTGDFATRHPWHFSVDVGTAVAPVIGEVFPYVGVNIYFRPVNRDARLSSFRERGINSFSRRFSAMIGYTWTDNLLKDNERLGLFTRDNAIGVTTTNPSDSMLVFGAGLRVTDPLRLAGGVLLFKSVDPNPLIDDTKLQVTPFISMSFDWDAVGDIKGLGGLMGFGGTPVPVAIGKRDPPPPQPAQPEPAPPAQ